MISAMWPPRLARRWRNLDYQFSHTFHSNCGHISPIIRRMLFSKCSRNCPPRSCDLTPLDYFLWGYVKSHVNTDKPETIEHLEHNIRRIIGEIRPLLLRKLCENGKSRLRHLRTSVATWPKSYSHTFFTLFYLFIVIGNKAHLDSTSVKS